MRLRYGAALAAVFLSALALLACGLGSGGSSGTGGPGSPREVADSSTIHVLSNRSDLISGGDALIEIILPVGTSASDVSVLRNGSDVTSIFKPVSAGRLVGLVTGLVLGDNTLTARLPSGSESITVVNHPHGGPVFSGPQLMPWACLNKAAVDAQCNQPPEYTYLYKSTNPLMPGLQPYDPSKPATDVASTTTDQGVTVSFIVRQETGYQNRDQYSFAMLYQPGQPWTADAPQPQFNHKLVINHGFSCGVEYQTGTAPAVAPGSGTGTPAVGGTLLPVGAPIPVLKDATEYALSKGFAVMSTALDHSGHNCNVALQAESLMMAKERIIEQYGTLRYSIGEGCSGGSLAQQWVANAYPGIYQGILPTCSFPDASPDAGLFHQPVEVGLRCGLAADTDGGCAGSSHHR